MWVARNKDGFLFLFYNKPRRYDEYGKWKSSAETPMQIDRTLFPNLKWEDDPIEVELVSAILNSVQEKLAESVDEYFDYVGHVQDTHPYSKEEEQNLYNKMCWRWQDWGDIKYDNPSTWDLNFNDYGKEKNI